MSPIYGIHVDVTLGLPPLLQTKYTPGLVFFFLSARTASSECGVESDWLKADCPLGPCSHHGDGVRGHWLQGEIMWSVYNDKNFRK